MWRVDDCFIHDCVFCYWMCRSDVSVITFALYERANVLNSVASEMVVHFRGCAIARAFPSFTGHDHCS